MSKIRYNVPHKTRNASNVYNVIKRRFDIFLIVRGAIPNCLKQVQSVERVTHNYIRRLLSKYHTPAQLDQ